MDAARNMLYDRVTKLSHHPTAVLTDAQDRQGATESGIKPLSPGMRLAGIALTVALPANENLVLYRAMRAARPGDVLVVDAGGYCQSAVWGELASMRARALGIRGLVLDGCVRDGTAHGPLGFPVFSRGVVPNNCPKDGGGSFGGAVTVGRVLVHTGDLIFGDDDGVVVVPQGRLDEVERKIPAILAREQRNRAEINAGKLFPDWAQ